MDIEAGASRYAVTVLLYLTAVTIYSVSKEPVEMPGNANSWTDSGARGVQTGPVRSVGPFTPDLPCADGSWTNGAFLRFRQSLRLSPQREEVLSTGDRSHPSPGPLYESSKLGKR